MKKFIMTLVVLLLVFVGCSTNKVHQSNSATVRYEQQEIERKADKAFQELDQEIKEIEEKGE